jgi:hypothetical protein
MTLNLLLPPADMQEDDFAYFKYKGHLVSNGYLDARKAALALQGIDEVMRFFILQQEPALIGYDFDIPIKIRRGSWEAVIPAGFGEWLTATAAAGLSAPQASPTLPVLTETDLKALTTRNLVTAAVKSIKWVLTISQHMGSLSIRKFKSVKFDAPEACHFIMIGLENGTGEVLQVPEYYLEQYRNCPATLFDKLAQNLHEGRELEIGFAPGVPLDKDDTYAAITLYANDKPLFTEEESDDVILFPDWKHGDPVKLEGHVTRGNEKANTIGFLYNGHVLTCSPFQGNVTDHKGVLFTNCLMKGEVDRSGQHNMGTDKRPHIRFKSLKSLSAAASPQLSLF